MEHFKFASADREHKINAVMWKPEGNPVGIVQLVHGMLEYIERYDEFARYLNSLGFLVVGHDHLGHGGSVDDSTDLGYIADKKPDVILIKDIHHLRLMVEKHYPDVPYFMVGHSMGSYLTRRYIARYGDGIRGVVLMGTGDESGSVILPSLALLETIALFKGWRHRSRFITELSYIKPYKNFSLHGEDTKNSWLTRDEEEVKKYYADEKCTFGFTINGYKALLRTVYLDGKKKNIRKIPKDMAVLFASGDNDPVGRLGEGTTRAYEKFCRAGILEVRLKLYEGARHELLHETNRAEVMKDIGEWLCRYVNPKRKYR